MPAYLVHGFQWSRPQIRVYIALWDVIDAAAEWIMMPSSAIALSNSFYSNYNFIPPCQPPPRVVGMSLPDTPISPNFLIPDDHSDEESDVEGEETVAPRRKEFNDWSTVKFLEQHDSNDEATASQPYAYVADYIVPVTLSVDIEKEEMLYEKWQKEGRRDRGFTAGHTQDGQVGNGLDASGQVDTTWLAKLQNQIQPGAKIGWYVVVCEPAGRAVNYSDQDSVSEEEEEEIIVVPEVVLPPKAAERKGLKLKHQRNSIG